jgi:endonuclease/exonuclease/phosphatase family metal-dependent hydrolase
MRIASFNVENLFDRAKAFNQPEATARKILADAAELNGLFEHAKYTAARKRRMIELFTELGLTKSDRGPFVLLRQIRERVVKRGESGLQIVADGRDAWVGWVETKTESVDEISVDNTARVIRDVNADVLAVVEAENRVALKMFSDEVLERVDGLPYDVVMVIDGNDNRGIDVGLMANAGFEIGDMRSHIMDRTADGNTIFSRDCPEYAITTPTGERMWVLPNHFKSKFGGNDARSRAKRRAQASRTAEIYQQLRSMGEDLVVVLGDLNDTPTSAPLAPLLRGTDLQDVSGHPKFNPGEFTGVGTFGLGNDNQKIDYLLLSPALFDRVTAAGLFRKGAWPGVRPKRWTVYPELTHPVHVASDHHVIWADIDD